MVWCAIIFLYSFYWALDFQLHIRRRNSGMVSKFEQKIINHNKLLNLDMTHYEDWQDSDTELRSVFLFWHQIIKNCKKFNV